MNVEIELIDLSELDEFSFNKLMLDRYQDTFVNVIKRYRDQHSDASGKPMSKKVVGDIVGLSQAHMTKLTSKKKDRFDEYQMRLSANYLWPCILKGVYSVGDFTNDLDKEEKRGTLDDQTKHFFFIARLQEIINDYRQEGMDPIKTLEDELIKIKQLKEKLNSRG